MNGWNRIGLKIRVTVDCDGHNHLRITSGKTIELILSQNILEWLKEDLWMSSETVCTYYVFVLPLKC